jgi:hypothetical protein
MSGRRTWVAAAALAALLALPAPAANDATVTGRVRDLPPPGATVFANVRAVTVTGGEIEAVQRLRAGARYHLTVAPGRYVLAAGALRSDGRVLRAASGLVAARRGRTAQRDVRARTAASANSIVTVDEVDLAPAEAGAGPTLRLRDLITAEVFGPLSAHGVRFVDQSPKVVAALRREERLSLEGRNDTAVRFRPLKPRFAIGGGGVGAADGSTDLALELRDLTTGQVVARRTATAPPGALGQAIRELTADFASAAAEAIEAAPPAATAGDVLVSLAVTFTSSPPGGRVTATPPGRTWTENDRTGTSYEFRASDGTAIAFTAVADAGFYFDGWSGGSRCGTNPIFGYEHSITCTVRDPVPGPGDEPFEVEVGPSFPRCPPPGTLAAGSPNVVVCPGVTYLPPPPD